MSRRFQIISAQVEAARKAEQERRAKFADKAAMYAVGADEFCRVSLADGHGLQDRKRSDKIPSTQVQTSKALEGSGHGLIGYDVGKRVAELRAMPPTWRTATKQWHKGPPPHEGKWISRVRGTSPDGVRQFKNGLWYSAISEHIVLKSYLQPGGDRAIEWFGYAPDADGWIKWDGGDCPVADDQAVEILCDFHACPGVGPSFRWKHIGMADILAYRVVK